MACATSSTSDTFFGEQRPAAGSTLNSRHDGAGRLKIGFDFGLYPGISTNDGGSPNLKDIAGAGLGHTALGTAGLDIRQVFLTVGNDHMGTIMAGRNIGLFAADVILNDMTCSGWGR